jgi:threonylcarbamoyladenosine tRNA methylthiotransferase MtaB
MPTFYIEQFGCRATQADGAALERQLLDRGYVPGPKNTADVVVLNTCTVTAAADAQARDFIRKIGAQNRPARLIVTGCYAQRAPEELAALPGVAWVVGNSHKPELPKIIGDMFAAPLPSKEPGSSFAADFVPANTLRILPEPHPTPAMILTGAFTKTPLLSAPVFGGEGNHTRPTLKIQDGCNARCSYCVIPFVRGQSRSLPPEIVVQEISRLVASGSKEIVLSGINLGAYGKDLNPCTSFESLLQRLLNETAVERLRISSIEPMDVTRDLIHFFAANQRLAQHFHMPLQSGADRILAAMHRWYRAAHYARRVELIHDLLPHAAIGADVIAGFPGESDEEHASTVSFIQNLPFTYLHVFSFSSRPGTAAAKLSGQVPSRLVTTRARELRALGERKASAFRRAQIGRDLRVLTLRSGKPRVTARVDHADNHPSEPNLARLGLDSVQTPALSTSFLRVRLNGAWPANQWLEVRVLAEEKGFVIAEPVEALESPLTMRASA